MPSMATLAGEVSVFADTNLGTRIAFNVPQDITAGAFKRDFERVHFLILPNSGEIQVNGLMVKRKLCFYYLPDSLPLKYVFHGMTSIWFLHVEVCHSKKFCTSHSSKSARTEEKKRKESYLKNFCISHSSESARTTHFESQDLVNGNADDKARGNSEYNTVHILKEKKKRKRRKFNKKHLQNAAGAMPEGCFCKLEERPKGINNKNAVAMPENEVQIAVKPNANSMQGSLSEMSTEALSVTGIIDKYFPSTSDRIDNFISHSLSDVTSRAIYEEVDNQPKILETPPCVLRAPLPVDSVSGTSLDKRRESKLRKHAPSHVDSIARTSQDKRRESKLRRRLLAVSQSLGISPNKQSPTLSLYRFKDEKLSQHKSQTIGSLFNISDSDN